MKFKDYKKLEKIRILRARLPLHILCSFPWCENDKVVFNYFKVEQLNYLAKYVGLNPETEV